MLCPNPIPKLGKEKIEKATILIGAIEKKRE